MTVTELVSYINDHAGDCLLDKDVPHSFASARAGTHPDPLAAEIINRLADAAQPDGTIDRAAATTALGTLRLRFMRDDAPVEGFRLVERVVHEIDGAFNDEALRNRS